MRWVWLAGFLAAGCGVATSPAATVPVCGGAVPPNRLGAIHFLTRNVGLALTLPTPHCGPMLAVSRDGGRRWLTEGNPLPGGGAGFVEQVAATSTSHAWAAIGSERLMATTDAGATWTDESPRGRTVEVAMAGRDLWMLDCFGAPDSCYSVLLRKALPDGVWTLFSPKLARGVGAAFVPAGHRTMVISDGDQIVVVRDAGRRLSELPAPAWMGQRCNMPAGVAAAGNSWWLLCLGGAAAGSSEKALFHTTDGGRCWTVVSQVTSLTAPPPPGAITREEPTALTAASPTRLWLAALNNLYESGDGGVRWSRVPGPDPQGYPAAAFDVLSPTHAWLLAAGQGLWRTTDGRHWIALGPAALSP